MGQNQSQPDQQQQQAATPEPHIDPAERARIQAEERARRAAAVEQRLAAKTRTAPKSAATTATGTTKKPTALEQMSKENKGWRDADEMASMRAYN